MSLSSRSDSQKRPLAAIYVRVSTEEQAQHGYSLAGQEDALKNYCTALGYELHRVYRDEGKSAKDIAHRPAMQELLGDAEKNRFSAIFIYKLDRFSRSLKDLILTIERLKEWGIDFISLQDRIETASASGKLMFHIISAFAEFERNIIGERTSFGMARKTKEGGTVTKPPFGYRMVNKCLQPDQQKAVILKQLFEEFLTTSLSLTKFGQQYGFSVNGLKKVLTNQTYLGKVKFAGNISQGTHDALVDGLLFEQAQRKLGSLTNSSRV